MASITCGNCHETHFSIDGVRHCYAGDAGVCGWQTYLRDRWGFVTNEDGERIVEECPALIWDNGRAQVCELGHEHVHAEARYREGWDYADGPEEAQRLAKVGVGSVGMDGHPIYV